MHSWTRKPQPVSPSYTLYRDCKALPLDIFISILTEQTFELLVISGEPSIIDTLEILKAWRTIYSEYATLVSNPDSEQTMKLVKRINVLRFQIERAEAVIAVLMEAYSAELVEYLRKFDINLPFNYLDSESYQRDLVVASNLIKRWYHDLKIMEADLPSDREKKNIDRRFFEDILMMLSKYMGYPVRAKDITVAEYAAIYRMYDAHVREINHKNMKHG